MRSSEERARRALFAAALAVLALGFAAIVLLEGGGPPEPQLGPGRALVGPGGDPGEGHGGDPGRRQAASAAAGFLRAYLSYQVGTIGTAERRAFGRWATPELRQELLSMPARVPAGEIVPRERVVGIAGHSVGLYEGEPALRVGVICAGASASRVLTASLLWRAGRWLVAGVR